MGFLQILVDMFDSDGRRARRNEKNTEIKRENNQIFCTKCSYYNYPTHEGASILNPRWKESNLPYPPNMCWTPELIVKDETQPQHEKPVYKPANPAELNRNNDCKYYRRWEVDPQWLM